VKVRIAAIRHSGSLRLRWRCRKETNWGGGRGVIALSLYNESRQCVGDDTHYR